MTNLFSMVMLFRTLCLVMVMVMVGAPAAAYAQQGPCETPQAPPTKPDTFDWNGAYLLGDANGTRSKLWDAGVNICAQYNANVYNNAAGGLHTGTLAQGQFFTWIDMDLEKFAKTASLNGTYIHAALYSMQGQAFTAHNVGSFSTVTFTEQTTTTRLGTVWMEKQAFDGKLSLRFGQLGIDDEFLLAPTATAFINATFGFPGWMGAVLPGGGAAYPLPGPGMRVKYNVSDAVSVMAGLYTGDPAGLHNPNPQLANRYGTTFNLNGGALYITEVAYANGYANSGVTLPTTIKVGSWYENGNRFNDQRYDNTGLALASAASTGVAKTYNNDYGIYGVVDQTVLAGEADGSHKLGTFVRVGTSPRNRNLVDFYADGGLTFTGLLPLRPTDVMGLGIAYDHISAAASGYNTDGLAAGTAPAGTPVRDHEFAIEALYTINPAPWLSIDLDVQHINHPGGHVLASTGPNVGKVVKDATVFGLNTQIKF